MATEAEITDRFWKALKSDMFVMLGVDGVDDGHAQPMTAQVLEDSNYIYFFTTNDHCEMAPGCNCAFLQSTSASFGRYCMATGLSASGNGATIH